MSLHLAANALEALAHGQEPIHADLVCGALALQAMAFAAEHFDLDLSDAALGLEALATGGKLDLNELGRARAAVLAKKVRDLALSR